MEIRKFLYVLLLVITASAAEKELSELEKKQKELRNPTTVREMQSGLTKTYKDATGSEDVSKYNTKDWENYFKKNGAGTGAIGNTMSLFGNQTGAGIAFGGNPNELSTENLRKNSAVKNEPSIKAFSEEMQADITAKTTQSGNTKIALDSTVKCYVTREVPIRYKCPKTGLTYGDGMHSDGSKARTQCNTECYEQYSCVSINKNPLPEELDFEAIELLDTVDKIEVEHVITSKRILKNIILSVTNDTKGSINYLDIILTNFSGEERNVTRMLRITNEEKKLNIAMNEPIKKIKFVYYSAKNEATGKLKDISLKFKTDEKYICPKNQDISDENPGSFAYLCPSGKINTYNIEHSTYKICEDYGIVGDNFDGTYSTLDSCNAECKENFKCAIDLRTVNTNALTNFREGCIEGQADCDEETCRKLRIEKATILNENVFDAGQNLTKTIVNGSQVQGVKRPRLLLRDDLTYQERLREELKDESYEYMIDKKRFSHTELELGKDTTSDSAYNLAIKRDSSDGVTEGLMYRSLMWILKPSSAEVNNNVKYKMYNVIEIITEKIKINGSGESYTSRDKILYVKTSELDTFKPFAIKKEFSKKDNAGELVETVNATWEYKSFNTNTNTWFSHSSSLMLEHFKLTALEMEAPLKRITIVKKMNDLMYNLSGVIRDIEKNGPYQKNIYDGRFTGKGEAIVKYSTHVYYTDGNTPRYSDITQQVDEISEIEHDIKNSTMRVTEKFNNSNETDDEDTETDGEEKDNDINPKVGGEDLLEYNYDASKKLVRIYANNSTDTHPQTVRSDGGKRDADVEIFTYGTITNKTGFLRIRPKKEDIGKKGHIFVFGN